MHRSDLNVCYFREVEHFTVRQKLRNIYANLET